MVAPFRRLGPVQTAFFFRLQLYVPGNGTAPKKVPDQVILADIVAEIIYAWGAQGVSGREGVEV